MSESAKDPHTNCLGKDFVELKPDQNYWQKAQTDKGAFIVDGASYYKAFREAIMQAERTVCILAWDLMGDVELIRDASHDDSLPTSLVDFIYEVVEQKPELEVYILLWDYSMVYLVERDWIPFTRFRQEPHPRIKLETDAAINIGASHHQKVVVIDGDFAFCGGMDISAWRWDTAAHLPEDTRRVTAKGESYQPYHDIHAAISGPAANKLDDLCRERWQRATQQAAPWPKVEQSSKVWPESLEPDFDQANTVFALTYSGYKDYPEVTQIEQLHLDMIASAERYIYIENQYLSSHAITDALIKRLKQDDGPEVTILLTQDTGGWLEEGTLGLLRCRLLEKLVAADTHKRFGAYYPHVRDADGNESQIYVHAKALICDDRVVMIGSANLSNRSMKVDSEIMMALGLGQASNAAPELLRRLLAMHLATDADEVDRVLENKGSINQTIEALNEGSMHQLRKLSIGCSGPFTRKLADTQLLDPDDPIDPGYWVNKAMTASDTDSDHSTLKRRIMIGCAVVAVFLVGLGLKEAWGSVIDKDSVETFFETLNQSAWTLPLLFIIFFLAGLAAISINLLLVSATLVIGPWAALGCGFIGSILSAIAAFYIGARAGQPVLEKLFADRLQKLSKQIQNRGIFSVALLRVVPIAPFVVINLVAGISKMKLRTFVAGSCLGMLPGMAGVVFVTHQAKGAYTDPSWQTWLYLVLGIAALIGLSIAAKKWFK
ncbi:MULTISPECIES: VTT domain-containing protein [unclassified Lentimonas]|uniref:VTT domain-containing protein n=1 Tax=unclassified Lentimonas TaxID=2630993 RepID=UPI0013271F64|nr:MULTISPECIES: VTT domain-containing protein [unclassified Lentimonas]CAA6676423.1 Phospholipase D/Transphosphatidylase [Lentimonas sp. CC4]CAA6685262.1 Phospholipase D/Transphosphatidylase [Lentimonas sp. CC6]CAA7075013.1 Phospholipase D/Transphosphatidylase [Lentimonas sp. CC4]CAA7171060.1 Phospholipase D/Transphosphatidylase [Lentimonas sp. CC21]CAA7180655.1 Phospholipase D/Transphosphatidylase [Lentimonas sp. CC8]